MKIHFDLEVHKNIWWSFAYSLLLVFLIDFSNLIIKICILLNYLYENIKYFWIFILFILESIFTLIVYCEYLSEIIVVFYSFLRFVFGFICFFLVMIDLLIITLCIIILFDRSNHTIKEFHLILQEFQINLKQNQTHFIEFFIWISRFVLICLKFKHKNHTIFNHFL